MPQPGERYNRFMKWMNLTWTETGQVHFNPPRACEDCGTMLTREDLKLVDGLLRCQECRNKIYAR